MKKSTAIFVWFGSKIMLSQRKGQDAYRGMWGAPGGRQDPEENDLIETARRELKEETGMYFGREIRLVDCIEHEEWQCFIFEDDKEDYLFKNIKNTEPKKHGPWTLFTIKEALKLNLMPALREYLLTKQQQTHNFFK